MREDDIRQRVRDALSERRFTHVEGVVETAERLARIHGADPVKARLAAWIHDYAREWNYEQLAEVAREREPALLATAPVKELLHGPIASLIMAEHFGFSDPDIASAVRYHTTGRVSMSLLDRIVCLADAIEPGRDYPNVDKIRECAQMDLALALAQSFDSTITYLIVRHRPIATQSVEARNALWSEIEGRRQEDVHAD